jgi:hypothetical protein
LLNACLPVEKNSISETAYPAANIAAFRIRLRKAHTIKASTISGSIFKKKRVRDGKAQRVIAEGLRQVEQNQVMPQTPEIPDRKRQHRGRSSEQCPRNQFPV